MRSKILDVTFRVRLVDEDDAGEVVDVVTLSEVTTPGGASAKTMLAKHLADVKTLAAERTAELEAAKPKPNRAQRRKCS